MQEPCYRPLLPRRGRLRRGTARMRGLAIYSIRRGQGALPLLQRRPRTRAGQQGRGRDIAGHLRVDQARVDRVHANAVLDILQGRRPRQADHAVLGGDVGADPGVAGQRATEALLTIAPLPWRCICRSSCFMQFHTPRKLIPITRSHSSRVLSAVGAMRAMTPALLNAASSRPNAATVRSTIAATWASSLTSHWTASAL